MTESPVREQPSRFHSPFIDHLGIELAQIGTEAVELRLPIRAEFLNSVGIVHGGVYASLADCALSAAFHPHIGAGLRAITMEMSCRYLRSAAAGVLVARGRVLHLGRSTASSEAEILVDEVLRFKASGTFMLVDRR
jgi:uncharacterized protein (TIGR00369 family)